MSIRTHTGPIDLCGSCGQPCYFDEEDTEYGPRWTHFREQWDGIGCQWWPFAGEPLGAKLDQFTIERIRVWYPNTNPDR
jgi:hypothetical protein